MSELTQRSNALAGIYYAGTEEAYMPTEKEKYAARKKALRGPLPRRTNDLGRIHATLGTQLACGEGD